MTRISPPGRLIALTGAASFFLWMFLAVAPIETLADAHNLMSADGSDPSPHAYRFAADWRHGMAGNSPLYMPGFFVLALAAWLWSGADGRPRSISRLLIEGAVVLLVGLATAWIVSGAMGANMVADFERAAGLRITAPWPGPSGRAMVQGLYTAATWMTVVVACRRALATPSFKPLLVIPPMTVVLILIRPWTVNDFVGLWLIRAVAGDAVALGSLVAIPLVVWSLVITERPPQWVQTHNRQRRMWRDV